MKVAIVTRYPRASQLPHGGVEAVSVNLVRALRRFDDLDLHVVTTDPTCREAQVATDEGIAVHRVPSTGRHVLTSAIGTDARRLRQYLMELAPDVVHSHDVYGLMVKGLPLPRVFTIHGFIYADTLVSGGSLPRLRSWLWRVAETRGWADQPHIISISPYVRERLRGIATGVIHDIENPITEAFFQVDRRERKGTIFSAALIEPRKNTLALVEAFSRLVAQGIDGHLRLAGAVRDAAYGQLVRERIEALGLGDRVHLLGGIDTERVREELSRATIFAMVSLEENAPLGIAEAMAVGVPVVASNRCGMPYMVRDGESGFLVGPRALDEIAWRLGQLLNDDLLRARMGRKARQVAEDRFHPAAVAARTREVYLRACFGEGELPARAGAGHPKEYRAGQPDGGRACAE